VLRCGPSLLPNRVGIEQRPAIVKSRSRFGDWEGGLMVGPAIRCSSLPMWNVKKRYQKVSLLKNYRAETFNTAVIHFYHRLPAAMRLTLIVGHSRLQFYFLKEADFMRIDEAEGNWATKCLKHRPRKGIKGRSPLPWGRTYVVHVQIESGDGTQPSF